MNTIYESLCSLNVHSVSLSHDLNDAFQAVLNTSAVASVVVLAAALIYLAFKNSIAPKWLYLFWVLIAVRFVLFGVPESPTSFLNFLEQPTTANQTIISQKHAPLALNSIVDLTKESEQQAHGPQEAQPIQPARIWALLSIIWIIGMVVLLVRLLRGMVTVRSILADSQPNAFLQHQLSPLAKSLGMRRKIVVQTTDRLGVPSMTGIFRPTILIPEWCLRELDAKQLELILVHELIHVRRWDAAVQLSTHFVFITHWFNPVVHLVARWIHCNRELSCDSAVVSNYLLNTKETERLERLYGQTILYIATRFKNQNDTMLCPAFMGAFVGADNKLIKQRIAMMVHTKTKRRMTTLIASMFILILFATGFTKAQTTQEQTGPLATQAEQTQAEPAQTTGPKAPNDSAPSALPQDWWQPTGKPVIPISGGKILKNPNQREQRIEQILVGSSEKLKFDYKIPEIMVDAPKVASLTPVSPSEIMVTGLKCGEAIVTVYNTERKTEKIIVRVVLDTAKLQRIVKQRFPHTEIKLTATTTSISVSGSADAEKSEAILKLVRQHSKLKVHDRLCRTDFYVSTKAKVYVISTSKMKALGVDWQSMGVHSEVESLQDVLASCTAKNSNGNAQVAVVDGTAFPVFIDELTKRKIAQLTIQPTLVTSPGQVSALFSGKEIPFQEPGSGVMQHRRAGTELELGAIVLSENELILSITASVSEVAELQQVNGIPNINTREISTGIHVRPGQTIALLGGLSTGIDSERKEVLFLIKPKLIPNPNAVAEKSGNGAEISR